MKNIQKDYGRKVQKFKALTDINLEIHRGESVAIVGKSGSGKSTLLNIIGLLEKPTAGAYYYKGQSIQYKDERLLAEKRNKEIGFVVQNFALLYEYTVFENIAIPLDIAKVAKKEKYHRVEEMMEKLEITGLKDKYPSELSGGEQQRIAIARALIMDPSILLADEPTGALDNETSDLIWSLFEEINQRGKTVIVVTHEPRLAQRLGRIIRLSDYKIIEDVKNS